MKPLLASLAILFAAASPVLAHTVRNADGTIREHDHGQASVRLDGIRNVSAHAVTARDCGAADWPDIPQSCLERVEQQAVASDPPAADAPNPFGELPSLEQPGVSRVSVVLNPAGGNN